LNQQHAGAALLVFGLMMMAVAAFSYPSGGTPGTTTSTGQVTVTGTSTSSSASQTTTSASPPPTDSLTVNARDAFGNTVIAPITMDGVDVGNSPVTVQATYNQHVITCGTIAGYATTTPSITFTVTQNAVNAVVCQYSELNVQTAPLTIITTKSNGQIQPGVKVIVGGQTGQSGADGSITFNLPVKTTYTVTVSYQGLGNQGAVYLGTSAKTFIIADSGGIFSVVSWSDDIGGGLSSGATLAIAGGSTALLGLVLVAFGGRPEEDD
jgi:hypothetical protein